MDAAVDVFHRKVLTDDRVAHFVDGIGMDRQRSKQKAFLTMAFGGPPSYSGREMRQGDAHLLTLGLDDSHVDAIIEILGGPLEALGGGDTPIAQVAAIAESRVTTSSVASAAVRIRRPLL